MQDTSEKTRSSLCLHWRLSNSVVRVIHADFRLYSTDPGGPGMDPLQQPGRLSQRQNQVPPRPLELNLHFNPSDLCVN